MHYFSRTCFRRLSEDSKNSSTDVTSQMLFKIDFLPIPFTPKTTPSSEASIRKIHRTEFTTHNASYSHPQQTIHVHIRRHKDVRTDTRTCVCVWSLSQAMTEVGQPKHVRKRLNTRLFVSCERKEKGDLAWQNTVALADLMFACGNV